MISVKNVTLSYGKRVLFDEVSLNFIKGNCYGVIGANGAGKSTFLKIVSGEIEPNKGTIEITSRLVDGCVEVRIRDTGTGIPESAREKLFEPFFTTKEVGKGTGQGLSLAYNCIVKRHKGTINFETELGAGTTFVIRLPLVDAAARTGAGSLLM